MKWELNQPDLRMATHSYFSEQTALCGLGLRKAKFWSENPETKLMLPRTGRVQKTLNILNGAPRMGATERKISLH